MLNKILNNSNVGELFAVNLNGGELQSDNILYVEGELMLLLDCYEIHGNNKHYPRCRFLRLTVNGQAEWSNSDFLLNHLTRI